MAQVRAIDLPTSVDYQNPAAQITLRGRRWTVEVELYIAQDVTAEQVDEGVSFALGGGSIESDHPLADGDFDHVSAMNARSDRDICIIEWTPQIDNRRSGRPRFVQPETLIDLPSQDAA